MAKIGQELHPEVVGRRAVIGQFFDQSGTAIGFSRTLNLTAAKCVA